jgi:hypothetical protein
MILFLRDLKNFSKILLEIINSFGKVAGYKINKQKSVVFLNINNITDGERSQGNSPFTTASKTMKCLGINLMKNPKTFLMKTIN